MSIHTIYLAGGCFWGIEAYLKKLPGVIKTEVGFANGITPEPTYQDVCTGKTGYAETVKVDYDSSILSLPTLLESYFETIDPTSINKQGNDQGSQYRTGIYFFDSSDIETITKVLLHEQKKYSTGIVTEMLPLQNYYPAEDYHQNYLDKNPNGYCHINLSKADDFIKTHHLDNSNKDIDTYISEQNYSRPPTSSLKENLTNLQYRVTQESETERPFVNEYVNTFEPGIYVDIVTGEPLFTSLDKFDSSCGWPSFSKPVSKKVISEHLDTTFFTKRTEVKSNIGKSHLGHVFNDGPEIDGGLRYCINSASLRFIPYQSMTKEGYSYLTYLFE